MRVFIAFAAAVTVLAFWPVSSESASDERAAQRCARFAVEGDVESCQLAVRENPGDLQSRRNLARS